MWGSVTTEFDIVSSMSNPLSIIDVEANLTYLLHLWKIVKFTHIHMRDKALQESHLVLFGISPMKKIFFNGFTFLWHIICRIHMLALLAGTSVRRDEPEKNDDCGDRNFKLKFSTKTKILRAIFRFIFFEISKLSPLFSKYGLRSPKNASRGLQSVLQAHILKYFLFSIRPRETKSLPIEM